MNNINYIKLSELNDKINNVIEEAFSNKTFWVLAEVTNHTFRPQKNYHNFELVEKDPNTPNLIAKIAASAWGDGSYQIQMFEQITGQKFTNNINVLVQINVRFHKVYGLSVSIVGIDSNYTLGALEQKRQETLLALVNNNTFIQKVGNNYITANKKIVLPRIIQHIAVISSNASAGFEDFKHTLNENQYKYRFLIDEYFTVVQGENNAKQLFNKLIDIYKTGIKYDAVVIIRGGGAQTDFLLFDNYDIGRVIAKFPIPIITGIGHQKNETIADLMAHTQTKTPTKAAEFILSHNKTFEEEILLIQKNILIKTQQLFSINFQNLSSLNGSIVNSSKNLITTHKDILTNINQITINTTKSILYNLKNNLLLTSSEILSRPKITISNKSNDLQNIISNIKSYKSIYFRNHTGYVGHFVTLFKMMSPENILKKGFAIVKINNQITSNSDNIQIGSDIDIILNETIIKTTVKNKNKYNGTDFNL